MKAGFVGVFGFPNSGKSSLVNALVGEKVSIVSDKVQTTRQRRTGILNTSESQIVFVDSPGFIKESRNKLGEFLTSEAQNILEQVDVALFLLSAEDSEARRAYIENCRAEIRKPTLLFVNKADLSKVPLENGISVLKNPLLVKEAIVSALLPLLPENPGPMYDTELYTTQSSRDLACEIIREKCFHHLNQEVPYSLAVKIQSYDESAKVLRIESEIYVARESHKAIVIGQKGQRLKQIGTEARKDIESFLGRKIFLGLHVIYKKDWLNSPTLLRDFGYSSEGGRVT